MVFKKILPLSFVVLVLFLVSSLFTTAVAQANRGDFAQIPTGSIPTVTGTPVGALIIVMDSEVGYANVRSGPGTVGYDIVGILTEGAEAPAIGRSPGGDWIQIVYPGAPGNVAWVYKDLVTLRGTVPVVEPPPTPTPRVTATIDPTLAAQFLVEIPPTGLPTFTPPGELEAVPTFSLDNPSQNTSRIPMGFIIIGTGVLGLFGMLISFLRGR
ncbi:MAG TPA: SH3 domain-containing protein [Anaerolineales bacterium]|nr:SH3 domain-containing protein [Anaerolineales bacterium]